MATDAISGVGQGGQSNTLSQATKMQEQMGKDAFLKLLVTQLQHQDPLNPMDNTEFVSQLAQFSSLEGITNLNTTMKDAVAGISEMQSFATAGLIGRGVKMEGTEFTYGGAPVKFGYTVNGSSPEAEVRIADASGRVVRTVKLGPIEAGTYAAGWDGTTDTGAPAPQGRYRFNVAAKDAKGTPLGYSGFVVGIVTGVTLDGGKSTVNVNGIDVPVDKIRQIY